MNGVSVGNHHCFGQTAGAGGLEEVAEVVAALESSGGFGEGGAEADETFDCGISLRRVQRRIIGEHDDFLQVQDELQSVSVVASWPQFTCFVQSWQQRVVHDQASDLHLAENPPELVGCAAGTDAAEDKLSAEAGVCEKRIVDVVG